MNAGSDVAIDTNNNDRFDILRISREILIELEGNYNWTARLVDVNGKELGQTTGSQFLTKGLNTITIDFDGFPIGSNQIDGPFKLDSIIIYNNSVARYLDDTYETTDYPANKFEGWPNNAPRIEKLNASRPGFSGLTVNESIELSGQFFDYLDPEQHTVTIEWGDGTTENVTSTQMGETGSFVATRKFSRAGRFNIKVFVTDQGGLASETQQLMVYVQGIGANSNVITVVGSLTEDVVNILSLTGGRWRIGLHSMSANQNSIFEFSEADNFRRIEVFVGPGDDRVILPANFFIPSVISGGGGDDIIRGGGGSDYLYGDGGADRLHGGTGNDRLYGNAGNDLLFAGEGTDQLFGGSGDDRIWGQAGNDELFGDSGNDHIFGGAGEDLLSGGEGHDSLFGQLGNDLLMDGSSELNVFYGGAGADILLNGSTTVDSQALRKAINYWSLSGPTAQRAQSVQPELGQIKKGRAKFFADKKDLVFRDSLDELFGTPEFVVQLN
jgi:Ca2+-binding RTX toxin-like protein